MNSILVCILIALLVLARLERVLLAISKCLNAAAKLVDSINMK